MAVNQCPEIEKNVLGAILKESGLFEVAKAHGVGEDSFVSSVNRRVWQAMCSSSSTGENIDLVGIGTKLPENIDYVAELLTNIVTTVNFSQWCGDLRRYEAARSVQKRITNLVNLSGDRDPDLKAITSALIEAESTATAICSAQRSLETRAIATDLLNRIKHGALDEIPLFPRATEGRVKVHIHKGEFTTIGGRSGLGKTAFVCVCVNTMLDENLRVLYFCTESTSTDILARIVAARTGVPHYVMQNPNADTGDLMKFQNSTMQIGKDFNDKLFIVGVECGIITPALIKGKIREIENTKGRIDVCIVDFIQGVRPGKTLIKLNSKLEQSEYCITEVHKTLIQSGVAGIMLSQLNRTGINSNETPRMEHLKDCSLLDNLSHTVAFLFRKDDKKGDDNDGETLFYSDKTRNQKRFKIKLSWTGTAYRSANIGDGMI